MTRSSRYTTDVASSLLITPWVEDIDWLSSARSAAKYAVGVKSQFCSPKVSSTAESTMAVCKALKEDTV